MKFFTLNTRQCVKKNNLYFRLAVEKDIENLRSLAKEIWLTTYPSIISAQQIEYMLEKMYNTDTIKREIDSNIDWYLILFENNPIGFISIEPIHERVTKINKFYIKTQYQGMGIGRWIFESIKEILVEKNTKAITLNVNRSNEKAIKAYLKYGFTIQMSLDIPYGEFVLNDYIMKYSIECV